MKMFHEFYRGIENGRKSQGEKILKFYLIPLDPQQSESDLAEQIDRISNFLLISMTNKLRMGYHQQA
ncbi:hypothetical protein [Bacillus swezeyi]|uniref:Uncharacterized protein n=1 Tax=Bacillus swezeyi TaxID=1925020 RepID=A0A5M8RZL8_9BACI|nr:hypothetical protein [Bacillus swezeyi]KAA6451292.1 hypothetical protein DX927_10965 [Bacillus swezeyi]TYS37779.1 hypothetical protein FZC77_10450 [Bacillus swezeyi]